MRLPSFMQNVKIIVLLDSETLAVYERLAAEAEVPLESFISDMLAGYFEVCRLLGDCEYPENPSRN